jgi:hypothetical protein
MDSDIGGQSVEDVVAEPFDGDTCALFETEDDDELDVGIGALSSSTAVVECTASTRGNTE